MDIGCTRHWLTTPPHAVTSSPSRPGLDARCVDVCVTSVCMGVGGGMGVSRGLRGKGGSHVLVKPGAGCTITATRCSEWVAQYASTVSTARIRCVLEVMSNTMGATKPQGDGERPDLLILWCQSCISRWFEALSIAGTRARRAMRISLTEDTFDASRVEDVRVCESPWYLSGHSTKTV